MAKFYGMIGFAETVETSPGVWVDQICEHPYYGDVLSFGSRFSQGQSVNDNISITNIISIVSDAYAIHHIFEMRYVKWQETCWKISNVTVAHPRLSLTLGEIYNGPTS